MNVAELEGKVTKVSPKSFEVEGVIVKKMTPEGLAQEIQIGMGVFVQGKFGFSKQKFWIEPFRIIVSKLETFTIDKEEDPEPDFF